MYTAPMPPKPIVRQTLRDSVRQRPQAQAAKALDPPIMLKDVSAWASFWAVVSTTLGKGLEGLGVTLRTTVGCSPPSP